MDMIGVDAQLTGYGNVGRAVVDEEGLLRLQALLLDSPGCWIM